MQTEVGRRVAHLHTGQGLRTHCRPSGGNKGWTLDTEDARGRAVSKLITTDRGGRPRCSTSSGLSVRHLKDQPGSACSCWNGAKTHRHITVPVALDSHRMAPVDASAATYLYFAARIASGVRQVTSATSAFDANFSIIPGAERHHDG